MEKFQSWSSPKKDKTYLRRVVRVREEAEKEEEESVHVLTISDPK